MGKKIGKGAFGSVYECTEISSEVVRAVKIIPFKSAIDIDPFKEVKMLSKLSHEAIPKVYGFYPADDNGDYHLVMEKCEGIELDSLLQKKGKLTEILASSIFQQLISAVTKMHENGIAHLDLKPSNIIFNLDTKRIKIIDFGFSTEIKLKDLHNHDNSIELCTKYNGSLPYVAPEILLQKPFDPRKADMWAIGIIYYKMLYGSFPWDESVLNSTDKLIKAIINEDIKFPREKRSERSEAILKVLLIRNPIKRGTSTEISKILMKNKSLKCLQAPQICSAPAIFKPRVGIIGRS